MKPKMKNLLAELEAQVGGVVWPKNEPTYLTWLRGLRMFIAGYMKHPYHDWRIDYDPDDHTFWVLVKQPITVDVSEAQDASQIMGVHDGQWSFEIKPTLPLGPQVLELARRAEQIVRRNFEIEHKHDAHTVLGK